MPEFLTKELYKMHCITGENYEINISTKDNGAVIENGKFGDAVILKTPLFYMRLKNIETEENVLVDSSKLWESVKVKKIFKNTEFVFENPNGVKDITVFVCAKEFDGYIEWTQKVINNNDNISVMEITYPTPKVTGEHMNFFLPIHSGKVIEEAQDKEYAYEDYYPHSATCMQFFAMYGKTSGVYIGIEDGKAASKYFKMSAKDKILFAEVKFFAPGASLAHNSFEPWGKCKWQFLKGDWYDAAMLYADFVKREATWLPEIGENGREDTKERFKNIPFWICDYIPNSESQGDNKPMSLSAGSDIYDSKYWYEAPIALQKELGMPIAYHVYNWHQIPFNIEYPHFLPAKDGFKEKVKLLQENNITVIPYINAVGWEIHDYEKDHEVNFKNTGYKNAKLKEDGSYVTERYPQRTIKGEKSYLAPMCGTSATWHKIIKKLTHDIECETGVDGIYFDQVSAAAAIPCYSKEHNHLPGGGNYWVEGYNTMMKEINAQKPDDKFYFSECQNEPFMKSFDGFLTWMWVQGSEVPAYSAIYAGYIQLIGRCTIGAKKDDFDFFKYCTAKSLLYGQQLGWCKADIIYSEKHMEFLKNAVNMRYKYTKLFNSSKMLRPPVVKTETDSKMITRAGLHFDEDIVSDWVLGGAWQYRNKEKTVIFAANISDDTQKFTLKFNAEEYGVLEKALPEGFKKVGNDFVYEGKLDRFEIKAWEI